MTFSQPVCRFRSTYQRTKEAFLAVLFVALANSVYAQSAASEIPAGLEIVKQAPNSHGLLCRIEGSPIVLVEGTPTEMGAAQGALVGKEVSRLTERVLYMVGGFDTLQGNKWFLHRMKEIQRRTLPHIPQRFLNECDALAEAAGILPHATSRMLAETSRPDAFL